MHEMGGWEWAAFIAFFVGASILAADTAVKIAPKLRNRFPIFDRIIESGVWGLTPLHLFSFAGLIFLTHELGWLGIRMPSNQYSSSPLNQRLPGSNQAPPSWQEPNVPATRTMAHVTPHDVINVYMGRPTVQGDALFAVYRDKWIKVTGSLSEVIRGSDYVYASFDRRMGEVSVNLYFDSKWAEILAVTKIGQRVEALCQITEAHPPHLILKRCELP